MDKTKHSARTIFNEALDIADATARADYITQACGPDERLRRTIEELIAADLAAGKFMAAEAVTQPQPNWSEPDEERVGRYRLLQKIGEGGCGVVYMADQEEPVRRRVALKLIKLGMDSKTVVARFEAERQALALMDHTNIAKVLDAGCTEKGRPFFVMELVKGMKITDFCDQKNLSTQERLQLFAQVCHAVQHAHQKGVIHRDIKPSNILVTSYDGVATPKVIDFGIAKAMQQPLTDKTLFTAFEQFIGTPAYMSPEQAEMSALDVDTRSDIYSLGVLLYELLTGRTPFDPKALLQSGLDEIRRVIREEEPARPSTCLSTMVAADATEVAKHRQTDPGKLTEQLHGDLDWIVMKALEKDRSRRYESADGFAVDIGRYLADEPVSARSPSGIYRFRKFVRRNKTAFTVAAAVVGTLLLGIIFMFVKVVPVLVDLFVSQGNELRWPMRIMLNLSVFLQHWVMPIGVFGGGAAYIYWKLRSRS